MAPQLTGWSRQRRRPDGVDGGGGGIDGEAWTVLGHARLGGDQLRGDGSGQSASVAWCTQTCAVGSRQRGAASDNGGQQRARRGRGRLSGRRCGRDARSVGAFMARRVAATQRERADRQPRHGKQQLTGGSLMLAISKLKFTPERK
jgi:hypothetical protein